MFEVVGWEEFMWEGVRVTICTLSDLFGWDSGRIVGWDVGG